MDASNNIIVELPAVVATKKSKPTLESLILRNNNLTELPESFERLMYLLKLEVSSFLNKVCRNSSKSQSKVERCS